MLCDPEHLPGSSSVPEQLEVLQYSRTVPLLHPWLGPMDLGTGTPNLALSSLYKFVVPKATLFFFL